MKKLIKYLKPYRFLAIVSPLMMIGEVLADLLLPYLTTFLICPVKLPLCFGSFA